MVFPGKAAFVDLESTFKSNGDSLLFNSYLPGYIRDLGSFYCKVFGVYLTDWPLSLSDILDDLKNFVSLMVLPLEDKDPEPCLWEVQRKYNLYLSQSTLFTTHESRMLQNAKNFGFGDIRILEPKYIP